MGVTGLTGFIARNLKLFTVDFELKNTRIIIDGSTLLRVLFVKSKQDQLNCQFGGNYVYYAKVVASFFKKLQWNNVRPYVVFQGSQNTNITEDSTMIKDKSQAAKLRKLAYCSKHFEEHDYRALHVDFNCLLADKAMMSVLSELNIPHIRVVLFSDEIVGSLAKKLKCPVFADDGNFYLCDLEEGFINGNLFEYDADSRESLTDAITCKLYQRSKFLSLFELKDEVLPVMSAILGNNFRKRGTYTPDPFVSLIERLPFDSAVIVDDLITESLTMKRISHLIYWLRGHTSESAGREFLEYLDDEHGEEEGLVLGHRLFDDYIKTEAKADFILSGYEEEDIECHWEHLNGSSCSQSHARLDETEDDMLHIEFSDLFGRRFLQEAWMKDLVDFRTLHIIRTVLIVDDYSKPCPLKYSEQLCLWLSALVNDYETDDLIPLTMHKWKRDETGRHELSGEQVFPARYVGHIRIPTLKEVKLMSSDSKRHILFAMLNSTTETYWTTGLNIIDTHDLRVIENIEELSLVYLILRYMRQMIPFDLRHDFYHFASAIVVSIAFHMGQDNAWLRDRQNDYEVSDRDRLDCLYLFNIFQRILQLFDQINQVFQYPLPELQVHKYLNGVLIANLYQFYKSSNQQPDLF